MRFNSRGAGLSETKWKQRFLGDSAFQLCPEDTSCPHLGARPKCFVSDCEGPLPSHGSQWVMRHARPLEEPSVGSQDQRWQKKGWVETLQSVGRSPLSNQSSLFLHPIPIALLSSWQILPPTLPSGSFLCKRPFSRSSCSGTGS